MTQIRTETKVKLKKIAEAMIEKWGYNVVNLSNYKEIVIKTSGDINVTLHKVTIKNSLNYLTKIITNAELEYKHRDLNKVFDLIEVPVSQTPEKLIKQPVAIVAVFSDGSKELIYGEIPKKKKEEVKDEEVIYFGLFDYKKNGSIIIRRGRHSGCDVTKADDIKIHFGNIFALLNWFRYTYDAPNRSGFVRNVDTNKDMETLAMLIDKVEKKIEKIETNY